jgi:PHD/YefM family antitoxin component YafN of YafNO toxin-antitoxin module
MVLSLKSDYVREKWRTLLDDVFSRKKEIVVERYNTPVAVLVNYDTWRMLTQQRRELIERLSKEIDDGQYVTQEEVERGLKERGLL